MGADVVGGIDRAVEIVEGNLAAVDDDAEDIALRKLATGGGIDPAGFVVAHAPLLAPQPGRYWSSLGNFHCPAAAQLRRTQPGGLRRGRQSSGGARETPGDHRQSRRPAAPAPAPGP